MPLDVRPLPLHRIPDPPLAMLAGVAGALYAAPAGVNGASQRRWDNVEANGLTEVSWLTHTRSFLFLAQVPSPTRPAQHRTSVAGSAHFRFQARD